MRWALLALIVACRSHDITAGRYQGMVELDETDLGFEVPGRVVSLEVLEGAHAHAGQIVARLDDTIARETRAIRAAELETARADLALVLAGTRSEQIRAAKAREEAARASEKVLEHEVSRSRALLKAGATARSELEELEGRLARARGEREAAAATLLELARGARSEEVRRAETRVTTAEKAVELADREIERRVIRSPIDATVIEVHPELGEVVAAGAPVATLVDARRPYADVFVPVDELSRVRLGAAIALAVEGDPLEVTGVIERVYPRLEFTPRFVFSPRERPNLTGRVRVRLDDPREALHAGQPAYVRLVEPPREASR